MLSRNAENLYWLARYMERAEATARLLTMGQRMAILPATQGADEWRSVLQVTGCADGAPPDRQLTEEDVIEHLVLSTENPSSLRSCLASARGNAKSVRTALTQDMWEAINDGWRKLDSYNVQDAKAQLPGLIDWVKNRAMVFRGATDGGHLRNEGHQFLNIGAFLERAQMTLRLLDVKYYVLLASRDVGGGRDQYQWTSILHALSGQRAYHHVYGGSYTPWQITDFLILNKAFPRSVAYCYAQIAWRLRQLENYHRRRDACHDMITQMVDALENLNSGEIFRAGLHETVTDALHRTNRLGIAIGQAYHFG